MRSLYKVILEDVVDRKSYHYIIASNKSNAMILTLEALETNPKLSDIDYCSILAFEICDIDDILNNYSADNVNMDDIFKWVAERTSTTISAENLKSQYILNRKIKTAC